MSDNQTPNDVEIVDIAEEMERSYIDYAMSVIVGRALPDVRDGLKPVHRRILYSMDELGVHYNSPYRKSARIVGDVMGKYHPHGDAAIYDAMARLAQDFSTRYMLVDGQGNFGSVDGDSPAAMRYTEARMSRVAGELMRDIEKETVDFGPNFDESLKEPLVLPSRFPNLLVNGSSGIAVGMATNIPPHNLGEVIDATVALIDNPNASVAQLMKYVKGPDFPTGGIILGRSGISDAYATGRGRISVRAKAEIEEVSSSRQRIVVSEIPYLVNKAKLVEKIAELAREKRIAGISAINDFSDRNGMKIVIELKRDQNAQIILNQLYKYTQMQDTFSIIMLALVENKPRVLNLREVLSYYIAFQKEIIVKRTRFDLDKALARAHILEGYIIALDHIDEVIRVIRASYDDAEEQLMKAFNLSEIQAKSIVDMRLRRLQGLEREKINAEYAELTEKISYYRQILDSEALVEKIVKEELTEIKDKYADARRTQFSEAEEAGNFDMEDLIAEEDVIVTITHRGYVKRAAASSYKTQKRGGRGKNAHSTREDDFVKHMFLTTTHNYILFFTNLGKAYRLKAYYVPEAQRASKGTAIVNILPFSPGEKITAVIPFSDAEAEGSYLFMATKAGTVKKSELSLFMRSSSRSGLVAINLQEGDELIDVRLTNGESQILMGTRGGYAIRFEEKDVRPSGRTSQGVRGMRLSEGDMIVAMEAVADQSYILTASENGMGRVCKADTYRLSHRGGKGVINYKVTNKSGAIAGVCEIDPEKDDLMIISDEGTVIRIDAATITPTSRYASGVKVMRLAESIKIAAIAKVDSETNEDEDGES